jgi:hypothetical protein
MDTIQSSEPIIKTDVLGRIKTPAARREQFLDEFERSGLTHFRTLSLRFCSAPELTTLLATG